MVVGKSANFTAKILFLSPETLFFGSVNVATTANLASKRALLAKAGIIYGDVEKPNNDNETSNSIGKTVLLKILNVILGAKNSGKNTIRGLKDYKIESEIKYNKKKYKKK